MPSRGAVNTVDTAGNSPACARTVIGSGTNTASSASAIKIPSTINGATDGFASP